MLSSILSNTVEKHSSAQQLFDASLAVFRSVGESSRDALDLDAYVGDWGSLLLGHRHKEIVGRETIDHFVFGFTRLLHRCIQLIRSLKRPLDTGYVPFVVADPRR